MIVILKKNKRTDKFSVFIEHSYSLGVKLDQKTSIYIITHCHVYYDKNKYRTEWREKLKEASLFLRKVFCLF